MEKEEKNLALFFDGMQVALGALMLVLVTIWIVCHLVLGHFNLLGFALAAGVWYLTLSMTRWAISDYKKDKKQF